jgi:acetyltransferase
MELTIRPIRPEDEPLLIAFHRTLSNESVQQRYFGSLGFEQRTSHDRLTRVCFNDYTRELALVVEHVDKETRAHRILAVGRLSRITNTNDAELALLVSDTMHFHGIGSEVGRRLVAVARAERISNLRAWTLRENHAMQRVLEKSGFTLKDSMDDPTVSARMTISG